MDNIIQFKPKPRIDNLLLVDKIYFELEERLIFVLRAHEKINYKELEKLIKKYDRRKLWSKRKDISDLQSLFDMLIINTIKDLKYSDDLESVNSYGLGESLKMEFQWTFYQIMFLHAKLIMELGLPNMDIPKFELEYPMLDLNMAIHTITSEVEYMLRFFNSTNIIPQDMLDILETIKDDITAVEYSRVINCLEYLTGIATFKKDGENDYVLDLNTDMNAPALSMSAQSALFKFYNYIYLIQNNIVPV